MRFSTVLIAAATCLIISIANVPARAQTDRRADHSSRDPRTFRVVIEHNVFNEGSPLEIESGDSVIWVNKDNMPHTATSTPESAQDFDTGFIQAGQESEPVLFLKESGESGFPYECDVHDAVIMKGVVVVRGVATPIHHESPSIHSMLVLGSDGRDVFLHHYDLFNNPNHSYHVTLEAMIDDDKARKLYDDFRRTNGDVMVSIDPEVFFLREIADGARTSFQAKFSEPARPGGVPTQWGTIISGMENVRIKILRIIQFRMFDPDAVYPANLVYQLFGNEKEVFLAHEVTASPNFQHVVKLKEIPTFLTPAIIKSSPLVSIEGKSLRGDGVKTLKVAVLSNSTHILLSPPVGSINPTPPLREGEELTVRIGSDKTTRRLLVGKSIWYDFRILNR
jgi:plastocyanin